MTCQQCGTEAEILYIENGTVICQPCGEARCPGDTQPVAAEATQERHHSTPLVWRGTSGMGGGMKDDPGARLNGVPRRQAQHREPHGPQGPQGGLTPLPGLGWSLIGPDLIIHPSHAHMASCHNTPTATFQPLGVPFSWRPMLRYACTRKRGLQPVFCSGAPGATGTLLFPRTSTPSQRGGNGK